MFHCVAFCIVLYFALYSAWCGSVGLSGVHCVYAMVSVAWFAGMA